MKATVYFYPFHLKIDKQDEHFLAYKWYQNTQGFYTRIVKENAKTKILSLHREILEITGNTKLVVEFANGDKNDLRRENLKIISSSQAQLKKAQGKGYTKLKNNKYIAQISINGYKKYLGCFDELTEAEFAYENIKQDLLQLPVEI